MIRHGCIFADCERQFNKKCLQIAVRRGMIWYGCIFADYERQNNKKCLQIAVRRGIGVFSNDTGKMDASYLYDVRNCECFGPDTSFIRNVPERERNVIFDMENDNTSGNREASEILARAETGRHRRH